MGWILIILDQVKRECSIFPENWDGIYVEFIIIYEERMPWTDFKVSNPSILTFLKA